MSYSRDELIYLLTEAAELEHMLCCNYLFAAFSTKRSGEHFSDPEQASKVISWTQSISFVARQEMEHLAMVCNLLSAIGGPPHLRRPNFPQPKRFSLAALSLEPLCISALDRFIAFEKPDEQYQPETVLKSFKKRQDISPGPVEYHSLGDLYAKILAGIMAFPGGDAALFIGPPQAQMDGAQLNLDFPRLGLLGGVYGITLFPVTDTASAKRAIEMIVEQGEGGGDIEDEASHYYRFKQIKKEMQADPNFNPAHPVVSNPILKPLPGETPGTVVTHEPSRAVMDLFNAAYEVTLLLLMRLFAYTDETEEEAEALRYAAFFPMMTMVIRPLGEILVTMPAFGEDRPERAGPSFETYHSTDFIPHKAAAWVVLQERFDAMAKDAAELGKEGVHERLPYIAESLKLIGEKFANMIAAGNTQS